MTLLWYSGSDGRDIAMLVGKTRLPSKGNGRSLTSAMLGRTVDDIAMDYSRVYMSLQTAAAVHTTSKEVEPILSHFVFVILCHTSNFVESEHCVHLRRIRAPVEKLCSAEQSAQYQSEEITEFDQDGVSRSRSCELLLQGCIQGVSMATHWKPL